MPWFPMNNVSSYYAYMPTMYIIPIVCLKIFMEEVKSFYKNLFRKSDSHLVDVDLQPINQLSDIPKLENTTADFLYKDISEGEKLNVLKGLKNKTTGSDGLTDEFYNFLWNDLKTYNTNAIQINYVY